MDADKDVGQRMDEIVGRFDQLRLKAHLLGLEGQDLLAKLERQLVGAERRLQQRSGLERGLAGALHELHQALARLRDRTAAKESQP